MFKKFTKEESVASHSQVKTSVARGIRNSILEQYTQLADGRIDDIIPKKENFIVAKCQDHINVVIVNNEPVFFNQRDGPYYPSLRVLHKYPDLLPHVQVDRGAIKFVMSGANIMCPGLTSPGGKLPEEVPVDSIVAVMAEGKQLALALGLMKMSAKDIRDTNKGIGIDNIHYLNDGLWRLQSLT